ncbi:hypothetical protein [Duganella sp. BJB475]|uniref:hypothetical protein n=1 Tax=Duganella sp. BJB475 TaxID=2233914 RepID=UPI000E348C74|nr:hypothetical protein [Duganella sp. BJB475]RFP19137.1 hypothetical protein D0T23_04970 [Duganella sp. BJB475]
MEMTTDMLAPELVLAPAAPAELNPLALLTIKPEEYVAQVFAPFRSKLAALKAEADTIHFEDTRMFDAPHRYVDISTTEGMATAVKVRAGFRDDVRLDAEKTKTARKAPVLQIGRLIDSTFKEIIEEAAPYEGKFDAVIKAEEKRKAEVKAAKERAEAERIGGIKTAIEAIRTLPARAEGKSAEELRALLERVAARAITKEEFAEFTDEARGALDAAGPELVAMFNAAQQRELIAAQEEAARVAETARLAAEQATADKRRADEAAENARVAAENAAAAQRLADQQAEIDRQRAELAAQQAAAQAERAAAEQARVAAETKAQLEQKAAAAAAERQANEQAAAARAERERLDVVAAVEQRTALAAAENVADDGRAAALADQGHLADIADQQAPADDVVDATYTPPTLRLGQINERIAPLAINADGLLSLGFAPADTDRAAKLYHEIDFPRICAAMQRHIDAVRVKYAA